MANNKFQYYMKGVKIGATTGLIYLDRCLWGSCIRIIIYSFKMELVTMIHGFKEAYLDLNKFIPKILSMRLY